MTVKRVLMRPHGLRLRVRAPTCPLATPLTFNIEFYSLIYCIYDIEFLLTLFDLMSENTPVICSYFLHLPSLQFCCQTVN